MNAGTVEFLMLEDGSFAFLEVNTRLQVEHPVTELVTGLDLVRLQLLVAEGGELPTEARFATSSRVTRSRSRLYAEDPTADWRPSVGHLHRFSRSGRTGRRRSVWTAGVEDGTVVSPWYDPMLAKVIAYAPTRSEAARALASRSAGAQIHGITTNRDLLVRILRHPEFLAGDIDTGLPRASRPRMSSARRSPRPTPSSCTRLLRPLRRKPLGALTQRCSAASLRDGATTRPSLSTTNFVGTRDVPIEVAYRFDRTGHRVEVSASATAPADLAGDRRSERRSDTGGHQLEAVSPGPTASTRSGCITTSTDPTGRRT